MSLDPDIVAVANDLMFASRIRAAATEAGVVVTFARSADALHDALGSARLVVLDLETKWLDATAEIRRIRETAPGVQIIAFASHVLGETLNAARAAGAQRVLARSAFTARLTELLRPDAPRDGG